MLQSPSGLSERISGVLSAEKQTAVFKHVENLVSINALYAFPFNIQRQSEHQDVHAPFTAISSSSTSTSVYLTWDKSFTAHEVRNDGETATVQKEGTWVKWHFQIWSFSYEESKQSSCSFDYCTRLKRCMMWNYKRQTNGFSTLTGLQALLNDFIISDLEAEEKLQAPHGNRFFFIYFPSIMPIKYSTT